VKSTGIYVPPIEITNAALRAQVGDAAGEVLSRMEASSGIGTRWRAPEGIVTSDLAVRAAEEALAGAGISSAELDMIVVGTDSPDYITPSTSVIVQHKLGASRAGTFDVGCACASFPTALATANGLFATNPWIRYVLVIGAYMMSRLADPTDPIGFFYGDGAGAVLLERSATPGLLGSAFRADGAFARHWAILSGGTAEPASHASVAAGRTRVQMLERYPAEVNDEGWPLVVRALADRNGFSIREIDLALFTQVRKSTIEKVMRTLELPLERTHTVMEKWGYTGSACLPMVLHDAVTSGRVRAGDLVVLVGSGVGHNQAGIALRVTDALVR
jgi:3-oxoacyl-[acyl-carrier-protein] synthase-3